MSVKLWTDIFAIIVFDNNRDTLSFTKNMLFYPDY